MTDKTKQPQPEAPPGAPTWMVTYADAMSLLLTFFVLLLTFSTLNQEDFDKAAGGLRGALGDLVGSPVDGRPSIEPDRISRSGRVTSYGCDTPPDMGPMPWTLTPVDAHLKRRFAGMPVTLASGRKGFVLRIPSDGLFEGSPPALTARGRSLINRVVDVIRHLPNDIEVAAHGDGTVGGAPGSPADMAVSVAQGTAVVRQMEQLRFGLGEGRGVEPGRLGLGVPGGTMPLFEDTGPAARQKNRRVEITLLRYAR